MTSAAKQPKVSKTHKTASPKAGMVIYVMHPQDHLLSCQLCPTFPPGWKEYGAIWLQVSIIL